jgi:hypothetical protein
MELYTELGDRSDLIPTLEVNKPEGYIGDALLPTVPVMDKTGAVYYATVTADGTAETDRAAGVAPDSTQISDSSTTFTAAEKILRGKVTEDEVKTMGGIDKADRVGFTYAIRAVMNAKETAIAALTLGKTAAAQYDPAKFFEVCQTALDTIRRYEGRTVLYGATSTLRKAVQGILADSTFGPVLSRTIAGTSPQVAATGFNFAAWMNALAMLAGVDAVLAGDSAIWAAGDLSGCLGIAKIDDGADPLSHKWKPVLGKVFQFMPDGTQPYVLTGVPDRITHNNLYDAQMWIEGKILNTGANYVIDGVTG